jgi:hypothetical protein
MGKQGYQRRHNRRLGWGREIHARQPLAPTDGYYYRAAHLVFGWSFYRQGGCLFRRQGARSTRGLALGLSSVFRRRPLGFAVRRDRDKPDSADR